MRSIDNTLGAYIDKVETRDGKFSCAHICVEVDMEKGLTEMVQLTLDNWKRIQQWTMNGSHSNVSSATNMGILLKIAQKM
jgi:hypothetical protein